MIDQQTASPPRVKAPGTPIRVLLVDDQSIILQGLAAILQREADVEVVGTAVNPQKAVAMATALRPDVALMDMVMNGHDGASTIKSVKQCCPDTRILVLTAYADQSLFRKAAEAGAAGYVLKDISVHNLVAAIRAVHAGGTMISPTVSQQLLHYFSTAKPAVDLCNAARLWGLTQREVDVLAGLVNGLTDKEIGKQLYLSESTIKTHLRSIYRRLRVNNRAHAVAVAVEQKLLSIAR